MKKPKKPVTIQVVVIPESLNTPEFKEAWGQWEQHRKEIRKPLTPTSVKQQMAGFLAMGPKRATAAIYHTIKKGWQGVREERRDPGQSGIQLSLAEGLKAKVVTL